MKIATWNINSLRVRLAQVVDWLKREQPDILALQEIKMKTADFPDRAFAELGYQAIVSGQPAYNGVAVLVRSAVATAALDSVVYDLPVFSDPARRILAVTINNLRLINVYVPNGQEIESPKYTYKMQWYARLAEFVVQQLQKFELIAVVGDFNVAPGPLDVYDPIHWEGKILYSQPERAAFAKLLDLGLTDCWRHLNGHTQAYSWWDYRINAFKRNLGVRIDHILTTSKLQAHCAASWIAQAERAVERPSDHAPVVAIFNLSA